MLALAVQDRTLFQVLDDVEPLPRDPLAPFRMSVIDRYKDMGTIAMGKSEAGLVRKGDRLFVMPNKCAPALPRTVRRWAARPPGGVPARPAAGHASLVASIGMPS